jgi:predicted nucleotidyltransferase
MNSNQYNILNMLERENRPLFFREISKKSNVSIGGTQKVLHDCSNFLKKQVSGRNTYYFFKQGIENFYLKKLIESERSIRFIEKNSKLKSFLSKLIELNISCLIFGSYASFSNKKNSDLDLFVLGDKKLPEHLCPVELHVVRASKQEFEKSVKIQEDLVREIVRNHVIVLGNDYFLEVFNKNEKN